jgi:hypothetical protein
LDPAVDLAKDEHDFIARLHVPLDGIGHEKCISRQVIGIPGAAMMNTKGKIRRRTELAGRLNSVAMAIEEIRDV